MQTTQAPSRLPGVRATTLFLIGGLVSWTFLLLFLLLLVLLIGLMTVEATQVSGHLPWPVAQWALTTPAGLFGILVICVGVGAPAYIVALRHILRGWVLARAVDVTDVPPWVWLTRPPVYPGETRAERWLGRSRPAQLVSLTLLGGAALICLLLVASFLAAALVSISSIPHPPCGVHECPPTYPLIPIGLASEWVIIGLSSFAQYRWLRRVEASTGVWLRYRNWFQTQGLCYIRQPGVTPEAAAVALARFAPAGRLPLTRAVAFVVLGTLPLILVVFVGGFLQFWLQTQWLPG
ncbi:MAG TPA: hypothetical protein VFS83_03095 [Ktedonobacterales bacterium]|nr:hypothetical protein [Ktedonobacterales bacterium]